MTRYRSLTCLILLATGLIFCQVHQTFAQTTTGLPPFSTIQTSVYDNVKINDGAVLLTLPVRSKAGVIPFSYSLNSNIDVQTASPSGYANVSLNTAGLSAWTPQTSVGFSPYVFVAGVATVAKCPDGTTPTVRYSSYTLTDQFGGVHSIPILHADSAACYPETLSGSPLDGSGYGAVLQMSGAESYITDRSGDTLTRNTFTDPNTNTTSFTSSCSPSDCGAAGEAYVVTLKYTDSTSNTPITETLTYTGGSPGHISTDSHSWTDAGNNTQAFTVNYSSYLVKTSFGCASIGEYPIDIGGSTQWLPSTISSPDGSYTISYESLGGGYTTGRISKVVFPSGASIAYSYTGGNAGITCGTNIKSPLLVPILTRTLTDTTGVQHKWKYDTTQAANETVVTDPAGNDTVYTFAQAGGVKSYYESQRQIYQGTHTSGTLLKTVLTCYNTNTTNCAAATVSGQVTQKSVYTTFPGMAQSSLSNMTYDIYGDLTEDKEYDFTGTLVSDRVISYGTYSGGACTSIGNDVYNRVCSDLTQVGTTPVALTNNTYNSHGSLTSSSRWVSGTTSGGFFLTSSATYNPNGTVKVATDVNGAQTTNTAFACNGNFPTSVSEPLSLSKSMTWDCNGGVLTSLTDETSQTTTYGYTNFTSGVPDPFYRLLYVKDPPDPTAVYVTNYKYTPTTVESAMNFNGSVSTTDSLTTTDGFGHALYSQMRQGQGSLTFDTIQYTHDPDFRVSTTSIPCSVGASQPCTTPVTTTTYDGLNRPVQVTDAGTGYVAYNYAPSGTYQNDVLTTVGPAPTGENTKRRQLEYDSLGRLTSVCELTSTANGGVSCTQTAHQTGYWSNYTYNAIGSLTNVSQNAQGSSQARSYQYDGLSRMTYESNPEWGPGAASYTYDSDSTCGTSSGDLVKTVDNAGNTTCYSYDALHRIITEMVYQSGVCIPPVKRFRYDSTSNGILPIPSGYSASNTSGRMIEAWTGDCVWPTPANGYDSATDEWFSYSPLGDMTDLWESTAHIAGYFHGVATYAPNGAITSLGGVPGYGAITYGLDGEGRLNSATQGTTDLVTGVTYMPSSQSHTISFGTGDSDSYTYDPNTGRLTNYTFNVNGATDSGGLTWNANGTLAQLLITDGINSGGSQTCTYGGSVSTPGYDDLGRLLNVSCGALWSQAFSYDPYGNITKSGSSAWAPGYSETTNHASTPITYDNNGNMTNDTLRTYAYYVDNKLGSINSTTCNIFGSTDGTCILYDAFGREVERGVNGVYTEVMYTPAGKTAVMNGQTTTVNAYFPLPGGATYYQSGSTGANQYFWHKDWLGSARLSSSITNRTSYFDRAFAPFGESYNNFGNAAGLDFTGDTQDSFAALLYDTSNRELHPGQGRWLSPDPAGLGAVDPTNPQTWNRYAYVLNNPLRYTDPLGLYCFYGGKGDTPENDSDPTDYDFTASDPSECGEGAQWIDNPSTTVTVSAGGDNGNTLSTFPSDISQNFQFIPGSGCSAALRTAHANSGAVNRYYNTYQGTITNAANANGVNPFFVAAVGIRESGLQNIPQQGGGQGLGVFQIDLGAHPNVSPSQALDPAFSANFAANMLSSNMSTLASSHPNLNSAQLLQATAASYNFGLGNISGNPNTIDVGTTGNNYGSNVVAITNNCF